MINLKDFPKESGVYWFILNNEIIYIGSSKNLYKRMLLHRYCIKNGSNNGSETEFYQFLQSNQFTVEFQLSDNYKKIEQELIEKHNPKFNANKAYTGLGARKGRVADYMKEYYHEYYKEEKKQYHKQYYESHKEEIKQHKKQYYSQLCNYNGETLTLAALRLRFRKKGISNPTTEAKKFLI